MAQPQPTRRERRRAQLEQQRVARHQGGEHGWVLIALAGAFLVSGAAGLMHEVVWARLLGLVFGATSLAIATVLAAYMGGLALGSYWLGTRSERFADCRRVYALLEIGIGITALLVPVLLALAAPAYGWLWRRFHLSFAMLSLVRLVVAGAILVGPTILMGATLPVLAAYCAGLRQRPVAPQWLYTLNLAGAALGTAAAGFVLTPALGVWGTILVAAALNVAVGIAVLALPALGQRPPPPALRGPVPRLPALIAVVACASGLMAMVTQVAWTRVLALVVGSTTYAFSSVLLVYLLALGVGSAWASRRAGRVARLGPDLAIMHALYALGMLAAVYAVNRLPYWYLGLQTLWPPASMLGVVALQMTILCCVLLGPVLCAGTILPLALATAAPPGGRDTGAAVGRLYAINTVGAIAGALLAGFVAVPRFGSEETLLGVALLAAALAVACAFWGERPGWLPPAVIAAAGLVVLGAAARPAWNHLELHAGVFEPARLGSHERLTDPGESVLFQREGPTASVLVSRAASGNRILLINARANASDTPGDMITQIMFAQVPLLVAPRTADVFLLGWGSGVTVGSALRWPETHVTAVEIEPAVVEASSLFRHVNHDPLRNPRLRLYEDDARHILLASEDSYDVIVSEPSHPWVSGVANLFTRDFYQIAARRLRPDGVFAQWLQSYQISIDNFRAIMTAYQAVFPEILVFQTPDGGDLILVGSRRPFGLRLDEIARRWGREGAGSELARIGLERPEHVLATLYLDSAGVRRLTQGSPVNTDDNMFVEFHGPADMVWGPNEPTPGIVAAMEELAAPIESALEDPAELVGSRDRLQALIAGLRTAERPTDRYEQMLAAAR